ncbi:MAG TPA: hypothetical protein VJW20_03480 [Candidatus Angelobacter sp.]|nr:hypothetical protein [Candidatus Angelobacter sp.]
MDVDRSNNITKQLMGNGKSLDLLIENASHSFEIQKWGVPTRSRWGIGYFGVSEQKVRESESMPGHWLSCLRPTGGRYVKNEVAGFLAGKICGCRRKNAGLPGAQEISFFGRPLLIFSGP